ncbi:MAG: ribosomal RNA small subunit methyltransferase A [candidate division Zixibacteria bacterium]|nr:ribosomal RNA small subunit methyltransferase A [candidate division Zixibacteria bacterium]
MRPIRPKREYGQHFLTNRALAEKIAAASEPKPTDNFIEIGPGKGILTEALIGKAGFILACELDRRLGEILREHYRDYDNISIMTADFLDFNPDTLSSNVKIIGNIPYNITTSILEKLAGFSAKIDLAILTVQKEVADKLTAVPGESDYGKLTVLIWSAFETTQLFSVPRRAFSPPPNVFSKVVRLKPVDRGIVDKAGFADFISGCFSRKNRSLINCMRCGFGWSKEKCENLLNKAGLNLKIRPREITTNQYLELFRLWQASR